ncbi:hypothetical protein, unlikely [Trypanosoma congolense IL3000]|uniref:Uncharacterized protein n=1 Tax=Trypanosoma congolense (strain IL3000) TaxID=1068625 RepID=F9W5T6_TRYCI|nr:hypothetical protein, unlikely [Trypanosoma congolense IL3000]
MDVYMYVCVCVEMHSTEGRNEVLGVEAPKRFVSSVEKENGSLQHRCGAKPQCHPLQHPNPHCHIRHAIKCMKETAAAQGHGLEIVLQKKTVKTLSLYSPILTPKRGTHNYDASEIKMKHDMRKGSTVKVFSRWRVQQCYMYANVHTSC